MTIFQPIALFPEPCGILEPAISFNSLQAKYVIILVFIATVFQQLSFVWSLLNRYAHAKPELYKLVYRKYKLYTYTTMISAKVTLSLCVAIPICYFSPNTESWNF